MLNKIYRLVEPRRIEEEMNEIDLTEEVVLVRPTYLSICNADKRYYLGTRDAEVLARKLPMALIHEGIGEVVADTTGEFKEGEKVILVPNTPFEEDEFIAENYLRSSKFRSSGYDGYMQDNVAMRRDRIVRLPEGIDEEVAAFSELTAVCNHAVDRFDRMAHKRRENLAVWGDGNLAFITSLILRYRYPDSKIILMAKHPEKARDFHHVDETHEITAIPEDIIIDHAFECVGGMGTGKAINQIIDYIRPEATISIMGVSENHVPINTRMVLEKGLRIFGSSRCGRKDFENIAELYSEHPDFVKKLKSIVGNVVEVKSIDDIHYAFEKDLSKAGGKTIMIWNI